MPFDSIIETIDDKRMLLIQFDNDETLTAAFDLDNLEQQMRGDYFAKYFTKDKEK